MKDFTLTAYGHYLRLIRSSYPSLLRFDEFFSLSELPDSFCLIRHDVDRKPKNALKMAEVEQSLGVSSTYYFRTKRHTFKPSIISRIHSLGHEIGYHYENLSDTRGDMNRALADFENQLNALRSICEVRTISMHGRPLRAYDNRKLWERNGSAQLLHTRFNILGEVYLHIDYSDIAYVGDTGRNWNSEEFNIRDKVTSGLPVQFPNQNALIQFLSKPEANKLVFQVHPERWTNAPVEYGIQYVTDFLVNVVKLVLTRREQHG